MPNSNTAVHPNSQNEEIGSPWNQNNISFCADAAENGDLKRLQWARENGCSDYDVVMDNSPNYNNMFNNNSIPENNSLDNQPTNNPEPIKLTEEEVIWLKQEGVIPHNQLVKPETAIQKQAPLEKRTASDCIICFEPLIKNIAFDPCGHVGCCNGCIEQLKQKVCPICTKPFEKTLQIFHSGRDS